MLKIREQKKLYLHKQTRTLFLVMSFAIPMLFFFLAKESSVATFISTLGRMWFFLSVGVLTTIFPLFILSDDKIYFFTTRKVLNRFHFGGIEFEKISRVVHAKYFSLIALKPSGAFPIIFLSKYDVEEMVQYLIEKNPDITKESL